MDGAAQGDPGQSSARNAPATRRMTFGFSIMCWLPVIDTGLVRFCVFERRASCLHESPRAANLIEDRTQHLRPEVRQDTVATSLDFSISNDLTRPSKAGLLS